MKIISLSLLIVFVTTMTLAQQPNISYTLGMSKPHTHLFEVEITLENLPGSDRELNLMIPAWRTGRYVIFDFAGGVQEFSAVNADIKPLSWSKVDKQTWRIETNGASRVTVRYKVFANEFSSRTRGLNEEHAFVDGSAVFMYCDKYKQLPLTLSVKPFGSWHVTTGLDAVKNEKNKFSAPNYEYFVDCPIEVGNQKNFEFEAEGKKHVLMIAGEGNYDEKKLIDDFAKLVKANKEFWGELPYERYIFMVHLFSSAGGATEHMNSNITDSRPFVFQNRDSYTGFLGTISHEYFHTWNVKQLRPKGIHPYDFSRENYVKELWIAEGGTEYYGEMILLRTGLINASQFQQRLASLVRRERERPGNKIQSATESSFDAWVKYWRGTEQAYNTEADYYEKGAFLFLFLDLEIRQRSQNKHSLDDVMKAMFQRYRLGKKGYSVDDFQKVAEEFSGESLKQFFDDYVHATKPLPWEKYLMYAGLELSAKDADVKPWLGVKTSDRGEKTLITQLTAGSPAHDAGLDINDEIVALNEFRVRSSELQSRVGEMKAGDKIRVTVFRDDKLKEFEVTLRNPEIPSYRVSKIEKPSDLQKLIYESWLKEKWEERSEK